MEKLTEKLEADLALLEGMQEFASESEEFDDTGKVFDLLCANRILDREEFLAEVCEFAQKGYVRTELEQNMKSYFETFRDSTAAFKKPTDVLGMVTFDVLELTEKGNEYLRKMDATLGEKALDISKKIISAIGVEGFTKIGIAVLCRILKG